MIRVKRVIFCKISRLVLVVLTIISCLFSPNAFGSFDDIDFRDISTSLTSPIEVNKQITFKIEASLLPTDAVFEWDFGDGNFLDPSAQNLTVSYSYKNAGIYTVIAKIRDSSGNINIKLKNIIIFDKPTLGYSKTASNIIADELNRKIWVTNSDNDTLTVINSDSLEKIDEIPVCKHPASVSKDSKNQIWVVCSEDDSIAVIDGLTNKLKQQIELPWGTKPVNILFSESSSKGYIAAYSSKQILELSNETMEITNRLPVEGTPFGLTLSGDANSLYVSKFISSDSQGSIWKVNTKTFTLTSEIVFPANSKAVDTSNSARGVPNYLFGIALHPSLNSGWVVGKSDNIFAGLFKDPKDLSFETTVRSFIGLFDTEANKEISISKRIDFDNHGMISSIETSRTGNHFFSTLITNNELVAFNAYTGGVVAKITTGLGPQNFAIDYKNKRIFTSNITARSSTAIDIAEILDNGFGEFHLLKEIPTVSKEKMTSLQLKGKQIFYNASDARMAMDGYISCASCHFDAGFDGRTWDFTGRGEGFRNTTTLRGQAGDTKGNLHWTGNFDEIQDFEGDIRKFFGGLGFMPEDKFAESDRSSPLGLKKKGISPELDALMEYLNSLVDTDRSPFKQTNGKFTDSALQGGRLFFALNCNQCHSGTLFSDSITGKRHEIGTLKASSGKRLNGTIDGLDTPTLISIFNTPPYLHDGSAPTLKSVFTDLSGGGIHDLSKKLNETLINKLVDFLLQLDSPDSVASSGNLSGSLSDIQKLVQTAKLIDSDSDGMDDTLEIQYFNSLNQVADGDFDNDGISNITELKNNTDPSIKNVDTNISQYSTKGLARNQLLQLIVELVNKIIAQMNFLKSTNINTNTLVTVKNSVKNNKIKLTSLKRNLSSLITKIEKNLKVGRNISKNDLKYFKKIFRSLKSNIATGKLNTALLFKLRKNIQVSSGFNEI